MTKFILFAPNVSSGGGLVLLREMLYARGLYSKVLAIVDSRGMGKIDTSKVTGNIVWAKATVMGRLHAEWKLRRICKKGDVVLCFHNLPPLLPNRGEVICYLHNVFVLGNHGVVHESARVSIRLALERFLASFFKRRVARYVVQTPLMRERLTAWYGSAAPPIHTLPLAFPDQPAVNKNSAIDRSTHDAADRIDFIYPSDGSRHKNHAALFAAWQILGKAGHFPSLAVTLDSCSDSKLLEAMDEVVVRSGARIINIGAVSHSEVMGIYARAGALIFPSLAESYGLPLSEATMLRMPILAPELDYVREVCEPAQTFDPFSPRSIAAAVLRHRGIASDRVSSITAEEFLSRMEGRDWPE